ncbi:hypothetical protein HPB51_002124 [Rhipicephalus microplus]|uniref:Uncharacterized protein n=1 Tax=Rhipicephalus microplus TaxID=6941 RepID=A0A9J6DET7_RHIMP|nr:hypothetical protein HPB51_002124 [Rhipicephalus microplus]
MGRQHRAANAVQEERQRKRQAEKGDEGRRQDAARNRQRRVDVPEAVRASERAARERVPEVAPAAVLKRHVNPLFKQAPPHAENSEDYKALTTKEGEPKLKTSGGTEEQPKDKDEREAKSKKKLTNSQAGAAGSDSKVKPGTVKEATGKDGTKGKKKEANEEAAQGQKSTDKIKQKGANVAQYKMPNDQPSVADTTKDKLLEGSRKSAGEQMGGKKNEDPGPSRMKVTTRIQQNQTVLRSWETLQQNRMKNHRTRAKSRILSQS